MTEGPSEPAPDAETVAAVAPPASAPVAPAGANKLGRARRLLNWFWRGRELKQLRREQSLVAPRIRELEQRSRVLFELGERARRPAEPLPASAEAAAAELFRQSAYWAVRAVAAMRDPNVTDPWQALNEQEHAQLAGAEHAAELSRLVERADSSEVWELPPHERAQRAALLGRAAQTLLHELAWRSRARDGLWIQRLLRIASLVLVVIGAISTTSWFMARSERQRDLAIGKAWRASSISSGLGCNSPLQECGDSNDFFFHTTNQSEPWIEIDLGSRMKVSAVRVENRKDCCFDRAAPLIVEVANDPSRFREVARRTTSFSSWLATFDATDARYVRLRVPKESILHLSRIRVLR